MAEVSKKIGILLAFLIVAMFAQAQSITTDSIIEIPKKDTLTFTINKTDSIPNSFTAGSIDSTLSKNKKEKKHSAAKAVWMSAVLPGLGQAYNKKYWKIPIVYAGFAGIGYAVYYTGRNFYGARNAYRLQVDGNPATVGSYNGDTQSETLITYRNYYKRYLDISAICLALWYGLNLVDAAVDGHLFHYDMTDKLSLHIEPDIQFNTTFLAPQTSIGLKFSLRM